MSEDTSTKPTTQKSNAETSLSPQEVERICKAFIRLLAAPLITEKETQIHDHKKQSRTHSATN